MLACRSPTITSGWGFCIPNHYCFTWSHRYRVCGVICRHLSRHLSYTCAILSPMIVETWKPIPKYERRYEVSNLGVIRSLLSKSGKENCAPKIMKPEIVKGYLRINLWKNGKPKHFQVHRLVILAFAGPPPKSKEVNHKDGNRTNCALRNLEYVTRSENALHSYRILGNKKNQGSKHGMHKITEKQAMQIRDMRKNGHSLVSIACKFTVSISTVSMIANSKIWRHIIKDPKLPRMRINARGRNGN